MASTNHIYRTELCESIEDFIRTYDDQELALAFDDYKHSQISFDNLLKVYQDSLTEYEKVMGGSND